MQPTEEDIANFLAFAPEAGEGNAFIFLEGANSINEAVDQYFEDPNKYAKSADPDPPAKSDPVKTTVTKGINHATRNSLSIRPHTNVVIQAANVRARDEQEMQNLLQTVQLSVGIYNPEIDPEHESDYMCNCRVHQYKRAKWNRLGVQKMWSKAVMYPGEKAYHDSYQNQIFNNNPYRFSVTSPYGYRYGYSSSFYGIQRPDPRYHAAWVHQVIQLNNGLNAQAQAAIDAQEPRFSIWEMDELESSMEKVSLSTGSSGPVDEKKQHAEKRQSILGPSTNGEAGSGSGSGSKPSKFAGLKKALNIKTAEEKAAIKTNKVMAFAADLRNQILMEEHGRWQDEEWRQIVAAYQEKVGMTRMIAALRARRPIQYLHLLRAGYFEPIPVAWANLNSNPLKFSIEAAAGWRGITPMWRGYEDTAEERLYWVLNHREGSVGARMKPDMISALDMARARMATAVEPPPAYFSPDDTCHVQHTSMGYSKQVMPPPFRPYDGPQTPADDTMILLDVSGSMDFDPVRPIYNQYLITGYTRSTQPKNKDVAKAIIRRFTDAMANHDHSGRGYQLTTFSSQADYVGVINHWNFDEVWRRTHFGGGTRVMTGWQKVKELHFQKHSESATYHPVYGWQAGPETPVLRLLLLLDGEATDMDEFELDLLSLSWVHVTIFLIGVDGCPHHHRHANELQRISDVNHHVSFVDAQGNTPERFVTHELLKRHLGYDVSMAEFEELEHPPPYRE